jgi:hypothetical protein
MNTKNGSNKESKSQSVPQNNKRENKIQDLSNSQIPEYTEEMDEKTQGKSLDIDPEQWYNSLQIKEDFKLIPGTINEERAKAINFHIADLVSIWVPNSCIDPNQSLSKEGIWVKDWFLRKKMEDIFAENTG